MKQYKRNSTFVFSRITNSQIRKSIKWEGFPSNPSFTERSSLWRLAKKPLELAVHNLSHSVFWSRTNFPSSLMRIWRIIPRLVVHNPEYVSVRFVSSPIYLKKKLMVLHHDWPLNVNPGFINHRLLEGTSQSFHHVHLLLKMIPNSTA